MSFDRSLARCSFCGRRPPEIRRMVAGPGAAYICDTCLQLCDEILHDPFVNFALGIDGQVVTMHALDRYFVRVQRK